MSLQIILTAMGDFSELEVQQAIAEARNEKISQSIDENEIRTKEAFEKSLAYMRGTYMIISGITQVMGGSMSQVFTALFSIAIAGIGTYQAIAAATMLVPGGQVQAVLMMSSLVAAIVQLVAVQAGQADLARSVNGINTSLHGIGSMISSFSI